MKKLIALILIICSLALCGCDELDAAVKAIEPVPTAVETAEPAAETVQEETQPAELIMINFDTTELKAYDPQNGTELILTFSYETPHVHLRGNAEAEARINEYIALMEESFYTGDIYGEGHDGGYASGYNNMLTLAEDHYNFIINSAVNYENEVNSFEFSNTRKVSAERGGSNVLSLRYNDYVYTGGAHGMYVYRGYCFDTRTGELLTLDTITEDSAALKAFLTSTMVNTANNDSGLMQKIEGFYVGTLEEAFSALLREGSWYFNNDGMVIFSDLYEMSSYAAGIIAFNVPYAELLPYIKPDYIPAAVQAQGSLSVSTDSAGRDIIDMVKSDEEGQTVYLIAQDRVDNVSISTVKYVDAFYDTGKLWYCSSMSDCALQLQAVIPEGMPHVKISYSDINGQHSVLLSQSGVDGSLTLVEDSIQPVG